MERTADNFLAHYGVKGMKWGVRRKLKDRASKSAAKAKKDIKEEFKRPVSSDAKGTNSSKSRAKSHGTDALSNKELKDLVTRMNLEQQYSQLSAKPSPGKAGRAYVGDILSEVGKTILTDLITSGIKNAASGYSGRRSGSNGFTDLGERRGSLAMNLVKKALT